MGDRVVKTPSFDRLALKEGVLFENAFVSPQPILHAQSFGNRHGGNGTGG